MHSEGWFTDMNLPQLPMHPERMLTFSVTQVTQNESWVMAWVYPSTSTKCDNYRCYPRTVHVPWLLPSRQASSVYNAQWMWDYKHEAPIAYTMQCLAHCFKSRTLHFQRVLGYRNAPALLDTPCVIAHLLFWILHSFTHLVMSLTQYMLAYSFGYCTLPFNECRVTGLAPPLPSTCTVCADLFFWVLHSILRMSPGVYSWASHITCMVSTTL